MVGLLAAQGDPAGVGERGIQGRAGAMYGEATVARWLRWLVAALLLAAGLLVVALAWVYLAP